MTKLNKIIKELKELQEAYDNALNEIVRLRNILYPSEIKWLWKIKM